MKYFQLRNQIIPMPMNGLVNVGVAKEQFDMAAEEKVVYEK